MTPPSEYEFREIDKKYGDKIAELMSGKTPKFIALNEVARQTENMARKEKNEHLKTQMQIDVRAMRHESTRLREEAGVPLKHGTSSQGDISGRSQSKPGGD